MKSNWVLINECNHIFQSNNFYVYELIDPRNNKPFYVGKGRDNRAWKHVLLRTNEKVKKANPHKHNVINQIIESGNSVIVKLVLSSDEQTAFDYEQTLIKQYGKRSAGGLLTNICKGGEGATTEGKPVSQFTKWGELVATYANAKEAARLNNWPYYSTITGCCKRKERSYRGWLWAYEGELPAILSKNKPVYKWNLDGELLDVFNNASEAARIHNCDPSCIIDATKGYIKTSCGFVWTVEKMFKEPNIKTRNKKVLHVETGNVYNSVTEAARATDHSIQSVCSCCKGRVNQVGTDTFKYC